MCSCAKEARWEKEALEQGLGNSFKQKKRKQKQKGKSE